MLLSIERWGLNIECMAETPTQWPSGPVVFLIVILTTAQTPGISVAPARLFGKGRPSAGSRPHWARQEEKWSKSIRSIVHCVSLIFSLPQVKFPLILSGLLCRACFLTPLGHLESLTEPCPISMANSCELPLFVPGQANWTAQAWGIWYTSIDTYVIESSHIRMIKEPIRERIKHVLCRFKKKTKH